MGLFPISAPGVPKYGDLFLSRDWTPSGDANAKPRRRPLNDYQPIACDRHDIYEIAILRGQSLRLKWRQQGETHQRTVRPRDLVTADGAEWLIADDPGTGDLRLRLDWISHAVAVET